MSAPRCYLDHNASAPLRPGAREACVAALDGFGNASSVHREGRETRRIVERARGAVATLLDAPTDRVVFTSGGTEAANMLLAPDLFSPHAPRGASRLLVAATEHAAVLRGHRFAPERVTVVPVDRHGVIDLDALARMLTVGGPALLALQAANNETGVIQPVRAAAELVRAAGGLVVCDAVQAVGRVPFSLSTSGADAAFVSAHKLGGPKGVGAAMMAGGVALRMPMIRGGGQEHGDRSGTENAPGIAGFGAAAEAIVGMDDGPMLSGLRDRVERGLSDIVPDHVIFGTGAPRLPNTTCFAIPGFAAETLLMALDLAGIAVSSGSACSSGKVARSHVLDAMDVAPRLAAGAVRVSFGWSSTAADAVCFLDGFETVLRRMQRRPSRAAA